MSSFRCIPQDGTTSGDSDKVKMPRRARNQTVLSWAGSLPACRCPQVLYVVVKEDQMPTISGMRNCTTGSSEHY